jgi:hypothetical protein
MAITTKCNGIVPGSPIAATNTPSIRLRLSRSAVLLAIAVSGLAVTACGSYSEASTPASPAVAVVIGQHSNSVPLSNAAPLPEVVGQWVSEGADVTVVTDAGTPVVVTNRNLKVSAPNNLYREADDSASSASMVSRLISARAQTAQADTLGAIAIAGRAIAQAKRERQLVIFDSGLSTVAPLAMQMGVLSDAPDQVTKLLAAAQELPDLKGEAVTWYGLGQTELPQQPLTTDAYKDLSAFWTKVLTVAGASSVDIVDSPLPDGHALRGLPPVTPVPVPAVGSITGPQQPPAKLVVPLDTGTLSFVANSSAYLQPQRADELLSSLAGQIKAGGYSHVNLTGTCALACGSLSLGRAEAVKGTLTSFGIPATEITAVGVGTDFLGFVNDIAADGSFIAAAGDADRLVIVDAN